MRAYIYCTKAKPNIVKGLDNKFYISNAFKEENIDDYKLNGKIVACFDLNKVETIACEQLSIGSLYYTESLDCIENKSCLDMGDLENYLGSKNGGEIVGYAWHIENLQVFDKPMELSDFNGIQNIGGMVFPKELKNAPQSWGYATLDKNVPFGFLPNVCILISIKPEWVEKILNGEKTIEVRKTCPRKFKGE